VVPHMGLKRLELKAGIHVKSIRFLCVRINIQHVYSTFAAASVNISGLRRTQR
jgi:hypothetical protein